MGRRRLVWLFFLWGRHQIARHSSMLDHKAMRIGTQIDQMGLLSMTGQQVSAVLFSLSARRGINGFQMMVLAITKRVFHYPEDLLRH